MTRRLKPTPPQVSNPQRNVQRDRKLTGRISSTLALRKSKDEFSIRVVTHPRSCRTITHHCPPGPKPARRWFCPHNAQTKGSQYDHSDYCVYPSTSNF